MRDSGIDAALGARAALAQYVAQERVRLAEDVANRFRSGRELPIKPFVAGTLLTAFLRALDAADPSLLSQWVRTARGTYGYGVTIALVAETCDVIATIANERLDEPMEIAAFVDAAQAAAETGIRSETTPEDEARAALESVMAILRVRDDGTYAHSNATASWCRRLADRLGLDRTLADFVQRAGLLHDVGKIGTPDRVLFNPGKLDAEDWAIMQRHAAGGAELIAGIRALAPYAPIVRAHHERIDGQGYPHGLRGDEIPFEARIVAVADAFDAMVTNRTYRPARSYGEAMGVLREGRGSQWDRDVVDAMIAVAAADRTRSVDRQLAEAASLGDLGTVTAHPAADGLAG